MTDEWITEFDEAMKYVKVLHVRRLNNRIKAYIGHVINENGGHAKFMTLVLRDEKTGRWIAMKLSTTRRLFKFFQQKKFDFPRRLTFFEKLRINLKPPEAEVIRRKREERAIEKKKNEINEQLTKLDKEIGMRIRVDKNLEPEKWA